jgi:hypothetical protein
VFKVKDHTTGKYTFGIYVVDLLWSNGIVKIPLGFKVYLTKEAAAKHNSGKAASRTASYNEISFR